MRSIDSFARPTVLVVGLGLIDGVSAAALRCDPRSQWPLCWLELKLHGERRGRREEEFVTSQHERVLYFHYTNLQLRLRVVPRSLIFYSHS